MEEMIVAKYLEPIMALSVIGFIFIVFSFFILVSFIVNRCFDDKDVKDEKQKQNKSIDVCSSKLSIDDLHISLRRCIKHNIDNYGLIQELFDDVSVTEGAILELNDRLNLVEIEIKNIKKVGKKNGSKK